jgi:hypothetical protein
MIFCVVDFSGGKNFDYLEKRTVHWTERGGTKKKPVSKHQSAEVPIVNLDTLDDILKFMSSNGVIVQIRQPTVDAEGYGFPHYGLYVDVPRGGFRQR